MATPRKNQTTSQDVSLDLVGPDGETASGETVAVPETVAASVAPVDPPEPVTAGDVRAQKLDELLNGSAEEAPKPTPEELGYDPASTPEDFGGRTVVVVLYRAGWRAIVDGIYREAKRGTLIKVTADEADRGERLGGLKRVEV